MMEANDNQQDQERGPQARASYAAGPAVDIALPLVGAVVGGLVGYWLFFVIIRYGFYAIILPGTLVGIGCSSLSGRYSRALGIVCGVLGLGVGLYTQWRFQWFASDPSFWYFLTHFHLINHVSQVMIVIGAILAYWFGVGRAGGSWPRQTRR